MEWALWRCGGSKGGPSQIPFNFCCSTDSTATYVTSETEKHPSRGRMSDTVSRRATRALNPDRPIAVLVQLARGPRSTVRSWVTGHRRPPLPMLKLLRARMRDRQSDLGTLGLELDDIIRKREYEPTHRTGFN